VPARYLPIYLNDHLFGSIAGIELCRRTLRENRDSELGAFLEQLLTELRDDRGALVQLMRALGIEPSLAKVAGAWTAEKLGRLKLNGEVTRYSPLSRVLELEGLATGVEGKEAMWIALQELRDRDERLRSFPLDELVGRARSQRERLEPHRLEAVRTALG
jgi:hypothetical protein